MIGMDALTRDPDAVGEQRRGHMHSVRGGVRPVMQHRLSPRIPSEKMTAVEEIAGVFDLRPKRFERRRNGEAVGQSLGQYAPPAAPVMPKLRTQESCVRSWRRSFVWLAWPERSSEEHTSELQSLMRNPSDVFCVKQK